ncbi:MAG: hypothetical protein WDN28_12440 [Chthoniobacter sp.]
MSTDPQATPIDVPATPPGKSPPIPLWKVLEDEFQALYPDLSLDNDYRTARDAAIQRAWTEQREAIKERYCRFGLPLSDAELDAETKREIEARPKFINGPACQELFQRIHRLSKRTRKMPPNIPRCAFPAVAFGAPPSALVSSRDLPPKASSRISPTSPRSPVAAIIGSWLSSWVLRSGKNLEHVASELSQPEKPAEHPGAQATSAADVTRIKEPFETEPPTIKHLRMYSNYLTPALGLLSGDGWAVAATVARNLLLNWLLIIPALLLVLLLPRLVLRSSCTASAPIPSRALPARSLLSEPVPMR